MTTRWRAWALAAGCLWHGVALSTPAAPQGPDYPASTAGVPFSKNEAWSQECMRVAGRGAPAPAVKRTPPRCNPSDLYYQKRSQAATSPAEWRTVLECASARQDNAVLMMLYANGFGVRRDIDIAVHYACSLDYAATAEMEGRIAHLARARTSTAVFDQCDDITSGYMRAVCAGIHESQAQRMREARLDRLQQTLSAPARAAFQRLRSAAAAYVGAASFEIDMQGTAAQGFATEHEGTLRAQCVQAALDVIGNTALPGTRADMVTLDRTLNAVYQKLMTSPPTQQGAPERIGDSTIDRGKVRDAERRWLAYRDAFIAFGATLPAGAGPDAINALLTTQRIAELNAMADDLP